MAETSYATASASACSKAGTGHRHALAPFTFGALGVLGLGSAHGGYFPSSWGWPLLACAAILFWAANGGFRARSTTTERVFVAALSALAAWYALSAAWSVTSSAFDQLFRVLLYAAGAAAALAVVRRTSIQALLAGTLTGIAAISLYALGTRLLPDRIGTFNSVAVYRLSTPLGYWNALGLLCAIGLLASLALTVSAVSASRAVVAALPAPVLLLTLYFTFSRGSWLSLGAGVVVALALDPRRLRLTASALALAVPAAIGVLLASHSTALTHEGATITLAAHDGHRLALVVLVLVVVAGVFAAGAHVLVGRVTLPAAAALVYALTLSVVALVAVAGVLVHYGGPAGTARRAWHAFSSPPVKTQPNLQRRLFSFSGTGRADVWRAAWQDFDAHPIIGSGAGSYESYWLKHRTTALKVKNAHSLYLETLAELGVVGLALLGIALMAPLVAAFRMRRLPGIAVATGAYVAYLVGAGVDWDWQLTSVTFAALLVGVVLLAAGRPNQERELSALARYGVTAFAVAIGAAGFVFLVGNMFLSRASSAAGNGDWTAAVRDAQRASDWLPWSTSPLDQLGQAQLGSGNARAARTTFSKAIAKDESDWNLWFDLARASTGSAQVAALAHAERLDPLSPEIAEFKSELGDQGGIGITVNG